MWSFWARGKGATFVLVPCSLLQCLRCSLCNALLKRVHTLTACSCPATAGPNRPAVVRLGCVCVLSQRLAIAAGGTVGSGRGLSLGLVQTAQSVQTAAAVVSIFSDGC